MRTTVPSHGQGHPMSAPRQRRTVGPPSRQAGLELSSDALPVFFGTGGIGGLGWVLPHVNVIDGFGLNDYVIARYRGDRRPGRRMAHERTPPPGYVSCFRPNVRRVPNAGFRITPRSEALTAEDVKRCEQQWRAKVDISKMPITARDAPPGSG